MSSGFAIEVVQADFFSFAADVLVIKYALGSLGLDDRIRKLLKKAGIFTLQNDPPTLGEYRLVDAPPDFATKKILVIGTVSVLQLDYDQLRILGKEIIYSLNDSGIDAQHIATTIHGVNTRLYLDEEEAFRALLLGFADATEEGFTPQSLKKISIVEFDSHRAKLFKQAIDKFLPKPLEDAVRDTAADLANVLSGVESFEKEYQKPVADETTPHVFVAMPFSDEYDDHYYLAIRPAITESDLLCVRLDQDESTFTGDIMEQVRERIRTAKLVVALLDQRNPNVYLEVGYAWGVGTPTLLILHEEEKPPFDVQGAKILSYRRMHILKNQLVEEMRRLLR